MKLSLFFNLANSTYIKDFITFQKNQKIETDHIIYVL